MKHQTTNRIGQRLKLEMKKKEIASAELAKRADVKTSFIYDVISGKSANPSTIKLARIADALQISLADLAGGGHPPRTLPLSGAGNDYIAIPYIMTDAAGGIVSRQDADAVLYFLSSWIRKHLDASPDAMRMLYICGDSMEPTLYHNDLVLIDTARKIPSPPGIFLLFDGFGLSVKRLEYTVHTPPRIRIISDNPQYSVYERSADDTTIIGRVAWFSREI